MSNPKLTKPRPFPFVCVGMSVLWHPEGEPTYPGCPATVTAVGEQGIDLAIIEPDFDRVIRKTGVRWNHDASTTDAVRMDTGGFDFTHDTLRLRAAFPELGSWPEDMLIADHAAIAEVRRLEAAIGGPQSRVTAPARDPKVTVTAGGDGKAA